jgi:hypothetical protein
MRTRLKGAYYTKSSPNLTQNHLTVNQKVFPKERFLRSANAIATDEAGINNKIR